MKYSTHLQLRIFLSPTRVRSLTTVFSMKIWCILVYETSQSEQHLRFYSCFCISTVMCGSNIASHIPPSGTPGASLWSWPLGWGFHHEVDPKGGDFTVNFNFKWKCPRGGCMTIYLNKTLEKSMFWYYAQSIQFQKLRFWKKKFEIAFSTIMGPFCPFWVIVCNRLFWFNWPYIDAKSSTLVRDVHCMHMYTLNLLDPSGLTTRPPDTKEFVSRYMLSRNIMKN